MAQSPAKARRPAAVKAIETALPTSPRVSAKPPRRRQEDRRADTRRRLIDATIQALYRLGYSAVTVSIIAEEAGVSRGIISYHFPTKADLMAAVRDAVHMQERDALEEVRERIGTLAYLEELPRLVLRGMRREPAIAVNEILLAARGDPELVSKLREKEHEIDARTLKRLEALYQEVGLKPPEDLADFIRVSVAAVRGLAMTEIIYGDDNDLERSVKFLTNLNHAYGAKT